MVYKWYSRSIVRDSPAKHWLSAGQDGRFLLLAVALKTFARGADGRPTIMAFPIFAPFALFFCLQIQFYYVYLQGDTNCAVGHKMLARRVQCFINI